MDEPSFREALAVELPRLRRLANRIAPPGLDPDDLVQDTLERAWRSRAGFRTDATVATWLHRIMVNRAVDLSRSRRGTAPGDLDPAQADTLPADVEVTDPGAVVAAAEDAAQLRAALSRLSTDERMVLVLHDGEGWTARRIAGIWGLPTATVHKRLQRGRARLLRELGGPGVRLHPDAGSCRRARSSASDYLDGRLDDARTRWLEEHVGSCERCPCLLQALIGLRAALDRAPDPGPPRHRAPGDQRPVTRRLRHGGW